MRQTALIYLHVTARLQLIHYFKPRTSYDLNFNTPFQIPSILGAVKYKFYDLLINLEDNGIMWSIAYCLKRRDCSSQKNPRFAIEDEIKCLQDPQLMFDSGFNTSRLFYSTVLSYLAYGCKRG